MQKENIYIDIKVSFRNRFLVEEPFDWESQAALKFVPEALDSLYFEVSGKFVDQSFVR